MIHRALIIGCGNIAGGLDNDNIKTNFYPLTHAKAFKKNKNFHIEACIDSDKNNLLDFQKNWGIDNGFISIEDAISSKINVDIVSICSPTKCRGDHLEKALLLKPKLVFCEKPLHFEFKAAEKIVKKYKKNKTHLVVNYSRRFDPAINELKEIIESKKYGQLRAIRGWYNKGLLNNGTHILDLFIYLFGILQIIHVGKGVNDYYKEDLSHPLTLVTKKNVPITLSCGNANDFSLIELEFLFSKGRIKMLNGGLKWSFEDVVNDSNFNGYRTLGDAKVQNGTYLKSFENALLNIHDCLINNNKLISSGNETLKVLKIYQQIITRV